MIYVLKCHEEECVSSRCSRGVGDPGTVTQGCPLTPRSREPFGASVRQRHRQQAGSGLGRAYEIAPKPLPLLTPQPP